MAWPRRTTGTLSERRGLRGGIAGAVAHARGRGEELKQEGDEENEPSDIHSTAKDALLLRGIVS
jgi:hypothetical protein